MRPRFNPFSYPYYHYGRRFQRLEPGPWESWPWPQVDEDRLRRIVREEIAQLPISYDVPDTPPEG